MKLTELPNYLKQKAIKLERRETYEVFVTSYTQAVTMVEAGYAVSYQPKWNRYQVTLRNPFGRRR